MLWFLSFFPEWVVHAVVLVGISAIVIGAIGGKLPFVAEYAIPLKFIGLIIAIIGIMLEGGLSLKREYDVKSAEYQHKIDEANSRGAEIVTKVVEKIVYKDKIITLQGKTVKEYIEVNKQAIDATCSLSAEAVAAHNKAAMTPQETVSKTNEAAGASGVKNEK